MNMDEFIEKHPLLPETIEALQNVKEVTGKPMVFVARENLLSFAQLKAARSFMDEHIMFINPRKIELINHIIVHECYHLFRFWSVPNDQRIAFSVKTHEQQELIKQWKVELKQKVAVTPEGIFPMWADGLYQFLYNAVTDARIEHAIAVDYPGLKHEQLKSLQNMKQEAVASLSKTIQKRVPPSLFTAMGAMNYAYLSLITPLLGSSSWKNKFLSVPKVKRTGEELLRYTEKEDGGLLQDQQVITKWSEHLDLKGVCWIPFERVPPNYGDY